MEPAIGATERRQDSRERETEREQTTGTRTESLLSSADGDWGIVYDRTGAPVARSGSLGQRVSRVRVSLRDRRGRRRRRREPRHDTLAGSAG